MTFLEQVGSGLAHIISPLKHPQIASVPVPYLASSTVHSISVPDPAPATILSIVDCLVEQPSITTNLLLDLTQLGQASLFQPLAAPIFRIPRLELEAGGHLTFGDLILTTPGISKDLCALLLALDRRTWISDNLFVPLGKRELRGKDYRERRTKDLGQQQSLFPDSAETSRPGDFRKAYTRTKSKYGTSDFTTQTLTIWDLIYPLLQPPLNLEFAPQFDVLDKLRPYQQKGITFLVERESALLADEMGTGKTVMALVALRLLFRKGTVKKALIVCPVSVLSVWQEHLLTWASELEFTVVRGSRETRKMDWRYPAHVYVAAYDTIASDFLNVVKKRTTVYCARCKQNLQFGQKIHLEDNHGVPQFKCPYCHEDLPEPPVDAALIEPEALNGFDLIIADEAQYIKNTETDRSRAVRLMKARFKWAITGTPLETKLDDLAAIFAFIKPNYLRAGGLTPALAREYMAPYFLRRLKKDVLHDLPPKIKQNNWLELDDEQRKEYDAALRLGQRELEDKGEHVSEMHIFALLTKLKRICNFSMQAGESPKTSALCDQVDEVKQSGHKLIVFTQWVDRYGVETLERLLRPYGVVTLKGGMSDQARAKVIRQFRSDPDTAVFLATVKAGGVGLTLTEANYVVHFDHWWNPATMWQAEDRVHRHGQTKGVNIYSFWMKNTIEEDIFEKLRQRGLLFAEVVDGLSEEAINKMISTEEWLEMLGVPVPLEMKRKAARKEPPPIAGVVAQLTIIDPLDFEKIVSSLFSHLGYSNVRTTKRTHDGGIDVIAHRRALGGTEKVIAQCKRMSMVGVEVGRELLGVVAADPSISKAYLVTSGTISRECQTLCEHDGRLAIIDGPLLAHYIIQFEIDLNDPKAKPVTA